MYSSTSNRSRQRSALKPCRRAVVTLQLRKLAGEGSDARCGKGWEGGLAVDSRKVDIRLHGKGDSNLHGARPIY